MFAGDNWETTVSGSLVVNVIHQNQFGIYKCKVSEKILEDTRETYRTYRVLRLSGENFPLFNVHSFENLNRRSK